MSLSRVVILTKTRDEVKDVMTLALINKVQKEEDEMVMWVTEVFMYGQGVKYYSPIQEKG